MPLQAQQIVTLATQISDTPGFTSQAGQLLNAILSDLCQTYNFDIAKKQYTFVFNPGLIATATYPNIAAGGGPYPLPSDYLRVVDDKEAQWFLNGVPYPMIPCDLSEYDNLVQQAGNQSYPYIFATDMSQSPPVFVVYPPPSGAYTGSFRYFSQMPDIPTPETSTVVPWFPNQNYLITRLSGELMKVTDDDRVDQFLGDSPTGAEGILRKYLMLKDDKQNRAQSVKLDRRQFRSHKNLPQTKTIGW